MKKTFIKSLSVFLSLALIVSPLSAFSEENNLVQHLNNSEIVFLKDGEIVPDIEAGKTAVAQANAGNDAVMVIAQYDKNRLKDVTVSKEKPDESGILSAEFVADKEATSVKAMLLENLKSLVPKTQSKEASIYSTEKSDGVYIDDDPSDYTYFRSDSCVTLAENYYNYTPYAKTGTITEERLDFKNPERGENIVLEKKDTSDIHIDIAINKHSQWESERTYDYFYISSEVWIENSNMKLNLCTIRDYTQSGKPLSYVITSNGTSLIAGKNEYTDSLKVQDWVKVEIYLDMKNSTAELYLGGRLLTDDIPFNSGTKKLSMVRFGVQGGNDIGTLKLRNVEVTGLVKKPSGNVIERTSVYPDTKAFEDYLEDKVSFHHFAEIIYKDGVKTPLLNETVYDDDLYVSKDDILTAFGAVVSYDEESGDINVSGKTLKGLNIRKASDSTILFPIKKIAEEALCKHVLDDDYGMVVFSDKVMRWDVESEIPHHLKEYVTGHFTELSVLQHMNGFLAYERPSAEDIKEAFNRTTNNGEMHPRLMGTKEDFERIKKLTETDKTLKSIIKRLKDLADAHIRQIDSGEIVTYTYNDSYRTLEMATKYARRMEHFGLCYQLTGESKYVQYAWKDIESVCSFPDFNEAHVIDCGMYLLGMAFAYDWLYHGLTVEQRKIMEKAAFEMGIEVMDRAFYMGLPSAAVGNVTADTMQQTCYFTKWKSNYGPYIIVGLIGSALAFAEVNPDICFDLIEKSLRATEYAMLGLTPDGAWIEGVDYWEVTVGNICRYMAFMEKSLGTDFNLWKSQGFSNSARAKAAEESFHGSVAHSDSRQNNGSVSSYAYAWYARNLGQNDMAALRQKYLNEAQNSDELVNSTISGLDVLYYTKADSLDVQRFPKAQILRGLEAFSIHENYDDPSKLFFFSQAGQAYHYHGHNDCGAFVFDMDNVRWAMDLGADSYDLHTGDRYHQIYRKRTEGHNTLTINNGDFWNQKEGSYSAITAFKEFNGGAYCVYDMTPLYRDVNSVMRGFMIDENYDVITVRDEIDVKNNSEVWWFMHTKADIEIVDEKTAVLSMNGKTLTLQLETDCPDYTLSVMDAVPLPSAPAINVDGKTNDPNEGIQKVAIRMQGEGAWDLTVRMSTNGEGIVDTTPISEWEEIN